MSLATVTVTGLLLDAAQRPQQGQVVFTPATGETDAVGNPVITEVTDPDGLVVIPMSGVAEPLNRGGFSVALVPTNTSGLLPAGWMYRVTIQIPGIPDYSFLALIPSAPNPVDLSQLVPYGPPYQQSGVTDLDGGSAASGQHPAGDVDGGAANGGPVSVIDGGNA